jgi:DNA modification methylase
MSDRVTLLQGDCLKMMGDLPDSSVDLILTDPPFGHNNNNGDLIHRREAALGRLPGGDNPPQGRPIANDGAEANEVFRTALPHFARLLKPGCCCCCCGGGPDPQFARWSLWLDEVLDFKQMVVWDKEPMGMGWHYRRSYETILVAQKPGAACHWFDTTNKVENIIRPNYKGIRKIIPDADDHPTPKPIELARHFIELHSQSGDVVFDPFMGRGWVGHAAVDLGRRFIGIEIDPEHFDYVAANIVKAQSSLFVAAEDPVAPKEPEPSLFGAIP